MERQIKLKDLETSFIDQKIKERNTLNQKLQKMKQHQNELNELKAKQMKEMEERIQERNTKLKTLKIEKDKVIYTYIIFYSLNFTVRKKLRIASRIWNY